MRTWPFVFVAVALWASPVWAKTRYVAYEGLDSISEGRGGTKVVAHDVDFWTSGQPPRRFQVLGIITDTRGTGPLSGDAVGSSSVAKKVKEVGGDAVIVIDQNSQVTGYAHGGIVSAEGNSAFGSGWTRAIESATTRMVVIKYLPSEATSPVQAPAAP